MAITAIAYHRPASLAEACELGRQLGADAAFLAGGTELLPDYQRERETARHLIALDTIDELHGIRVDGTTLRIGALATVAEVASSPLVRQWFLALAEAARAIGSPQIRSRATIGGNFCRAVPCADTPPSAVVAGARLRLVGPGGERQLDAADFFVGPRQTVLQPGEVLVEIVLPAQPEHSGASYQRFSRRQGPALAVAAVAARVDAQGPDDRGRPHCARRGGAGAAARHPRRGGARRSSRFHGALRPGRRGLRRRGAPDHRPAGFGGRSGMNWSPC